MDTQLLQLVPTFAELLGPNWEACTVWQAREALDSSLPTLPQPLAEQLRYTLSLLSYTWRGDHKSTAAAHPDLGELGVWREVLISGKQVPQVGKHRGALLSRLFEIPTATLAPDDSLANIPTFAQLLGSEWEACNYHEGLSALRAWLKLNPSRQHASIINALQRAYSNSDGGSLYELRQYVATPRLRLRNVGFKGMQALSHLLGLQVQEADPQPATPSLTRELAQERALDLCARLSLEQLALWLDLGQKMVAHTTQEQE